MVLFYINKSTASVFWGGKKTVSTKQMILGSVWGQFRKLDSFFYVVLHTECDGALSFAC